MNHRDKNEEDDTMFTCDGCKERSCIPCDVRWHDGQTCAQYQANGRTDREQTTYDTLIAEQEELSRQAIKRVARRCPGAECGVPMMQDYREDSCDKLRYKWHGCQFTPCHVRSVRS